MSGAARINEKLKGVDVLPRFVDPTTLRVNLKKHPIDAHEVGSKVSFHGHGHIKSIHKDEYGHRMEIDVKKIKGAGKSAPADMEEHD